MVISRSDAKRRRREGDSLEDTLQGSPKRTKVHAQRKFAQGSSNLSSPALTPVKDKEKVKTNGTVLSPEEKVKTNGTVLSPDLIPSKRPKTEDFLTFLCFRGTPILPPQLDFFNVATVPENQDEEQGSSQGDCSSSRMATVMSAGHKLHRSASTEQSVASSVVKRSDRLRSNAKKKPTTAVQAIRKKYQEQRLAKQRARTLTTLVHKVKSKSVIQTRSSTVSEETRPLTIHKLKAKKQIIKKRSGKIIQTTKKLKTLKYMPLRRISARGRRKTRRDLRHHPIRRGGLRSGGQLPPGSEEGLKKEKIQHIRTSLKEKKDKNETNVFASSLSDFSSDDDQPLVKRTRPLEQSTKQKLARKVIKRIVKSSRKVHLHMVTRSKQQTPTPVTATKVSTRPTRKTKEAAALYMELLGKKLITPEAEADEDSLSIDSFPELPNSRRNEQRENEMKARLNKEKNMKMQKLESQMKKDAKKDVPAQKKDTILQKKGGQIQKDDPKKENAEKLKSEVISGSPSGSEEGKRRVIRTKKEKERKLREIEKVEDAKEKVVKLKDSNKSDDAQGRIMRSMDLDKPGIKGKISKSKDEEGKGNMNKHKESSRIEEIKGRPVRHKGIGIKCEDVAVGDSKLKETDRVEEPKGKTRSRENEEVKKLLKGKVVSRSETIKKRVKRYKEIEKTNSIKSKLVKSKENNEIEGMMNTDKPGDVEESVGRIVKSKELDSSAGEQVINSTEKVAEGKGRMTKVKEIEKSQEAKERRTTEKSEDDKPKFVKASNGSKQEENKMKFDDRVEELKGRSGRNKETNKVQELKGRTKVKEVDEIESTKGKVVDKIEPAKGKVTKLKDNESIKGRTMRTRETDESKAGSANVKELENKDDDVHKVSQDSGGVKSSKMQRTHEDEKGKQKATCKTRVNRKDANVDAPKKSKGPKAPINKQSPAIKKKSVDSEDDNWEDEGEQEEIGNGMKPPIPPRRSLRRSSHDQSQPGSESLDSLTGETATTRNSSRRSSSHSSLSPVGRQIQKSSKARDSSEDKFSDSDEEPLGKIALKNSSACHKSNDSREEKKHGKDEGADCKKQPSKDTLQSDDNVQGMNSKNKCIKKFPKTKPNSTKILSKPLGGKEVLGKSKSVKTVTTEDDSGKKRPLDSDSKGELQILNQSKNLVGCSKSTGKNVCSEHDLKQKSALDGKVDESYLNHSIPGDNADDDSSLESERDSEVNRCEKIVHPILDEDHNTNVISSKDNGKIPGTKFSTVLYKENEQSEKVDSQSSETNSATKNEPFLDSEKKSSSSTGEKEGTRGLLSLEEDHNDGSLTSPVDLKTLDKASLLVEKSSRFPLSPESKKSEKSSVSPVAKKLNKRLSFSPERKIADRSCTSFERKASKRVSSSPEDKKVEVKKTGKRLTSSPEGKKLAEKVLILSEQKKSDNSLSSHHGKKLVNKPPLSPEGKNVYKANSSDGKSTDKSAISSDEKQSLKSLSSPECSKSANKPLSGEKLNRRLTSSPELRKLDDQQHLSLEEGKSQKSLFPSPELKKLSDSSSQSSDKLPLSLYDKSPSDSFPSKERGLCSERPATSDDGYSTDKLCSPSENDGGELSHLPVVKKTTLRMDDDDSNSEFLASSDGKKTADMCCLLSEENKLNLLSDKKLDEISSLLPEESESSSKLSPLFDGSKTSSIPSKELELSPFSSTLRESVTCCKLPPSPNKLADSFYLQSGEIKSNSSSKKSTDSTSQCFEESSLVNKSPEKRKILSNKLLSLGEKKPVPQDKMLGDQLPVSEMISNNIPEFNEGEMLSGNSLEERTSTIENQLVGSKLYSPHDNQEERKLSSSEGKNLANRLSLSPEGKRSAITIPSSPNEISVVPKESKSTCRSFIFAVDDKTTDKSVLNTEGTPASGKSSERSITDAKESMKNLAVNKLSMLTEAEKLMPELPSTSTEESNTLSESSLVSIAKKLTPIISSEKKRLTQKFSLLNTLKVLSNSDNMDKESDRNYFISNYKFPPLKGDVAYDSISSEIKPRNFYDKNLKDLKSSILEKKEKYNDTLSVLQKSESSFPNSDEGNNSKPEGGHLIVLHRPKKQGGIKPMNQEDPLSVHKLPAGKSAVGLDPEVRKGSRSSLQRRESNTSKKLEGQRKSSLACPKETELELQRRLSMVCLKETDSEPSTESGCEGESRERSSFMIEKESCLGETTQEPTFLTEKGTCQGETGHEPSSVRGKELCKEQKLGCKDSDKIPYPGESEVERHKRLIQKAKEELEQRLNSRDVGDVFKLTSSKMSKKHCSEKVVNATGNVAKHGKFHDAAKKLNQDIPKGSKKEGVAKLSSWTERSQKSVVSHNSVRQSKSCEAQKPSETENERKMLQGLEIMSEGKVDSNQDREPKEGRTSNVIFPENLTPVLTKPSDSVVDCSLNKRKLIETNESPDISKSYNLLGELRTHDQVGSILNFYSSQETNVPNINPVQTEEIQSNHFKNVGKQLQGSHVQVNPSAESFSVRTTNCEEAAERPMITTVFQDDRVNQRLFFCKEPVLQEGMNKVQNFVANLTNEVVYHRQSNPEHVSGRERSIDIISAPSCSQSIMNVHPPKDLSTLGDCKKGRVNERIEKWLSESCSGSLVHKKDCSMIDGSSCKCGVAVSDEEMLLSELPGERLTSDGIPSSNDLEESTPRLAKVGCPLLLSDVTGERIYQSEKISALRLDDFKRTLGSECVDKTENKRIAEQTVSSIPTTCSTSNAPVDEVQKTSSLNFMLSSIAQNSITSPATDIINCTVPWQNMKGFSVKNSNSSHEMQGITVEHSATLPTSENCDISAARKEELYVDRGKNLELAPVLPDLTTQELVKEQVDNQEHSLVEDLSEKAKVSLSSEQISKKALDSSKIETYFNPRTGGKPVQISDRTAEKKSIFQQRRSFLHKTKERKDLTPSANAFSPENESSVYAFETEPESPPVSTPFRSRARDSRTSSTTTSKSEEDLAKLGEEEISSPAVVSLPPPVTVQIIQAEKPVMCVAVQSSPSCILPQTCTTSTQSVTSPVTISRTSTSIAVQVNLDSESGLDSSPQGTLPAENALPEPAQRSMECSTQTEVTEDDDDESEGHLFYIPLQQAPTPSQQLIQGVAVKLGTEGPTGPNQRVIMRAKLVTKAPNFSRTSGGSAQDGALGMRRSVLGHQHQRPSSMLMMEQKSSYYNSIGMSSPSSSGTYPPVGTVQPTARSRPSTETTSQSRSDATTGTCDSDLKNFPSDTEVKQSGTKMNKVVPKLGSSVKEKTTEIDTPGPSTSCSTAVTPVKSSTTKASKEKSSAVQTSPSAPGKGGSGVKRNIQKGKGSRALDGSCTPSNITTFPSLDSSPQLVEAPTFHPSEKEFQDPLEFIDRIRPVAERFGLCRVVPPSNFKPECKVTDDMRFTAYNQYVHKMLHRWGPNVMEMMAIRKYLATQGIPFTHPPWIGGMEVDLPRLYQTVQSFGGLKEVIEKKRWQRVADSMKIPKSAQDRVTKLDDIYCKYLLPYDTLSPDERQKLFDEVETEWALRESRITSQLTGTTVENPEEDDISDENEECIVKGRNMPLNAFYRIARNTMSMWFRQPEPSASEVEQEFWRHVTTRTSHVCVHSGSIDSSGWGYGFPCSKNSPFARHPWNLKVLTNNSGSVLRSMGPIMGVTVPTLHVGMVFTTCCWYRDPHGLPWIEYLHTGASKIWYGIPDTYSSAFRTAMSKLVPKYCRNKTIWLPSDTAMVPPSLLVKHGVSLCHTVQEPGQFIVVFPRAFTSSICTGYLVSESVYFAQPSWLSTAEQVFKDIQNSCEPSMFSLERLLFSIASDTRSHVEVLRQVLPMILCIRQQELDYRKQLYNLGLKTSERLPLPEANVKRRKLRPALEEECDYECEMCRANLFVSLVTNSHEEGVYCLPHAIDLLTKKRHHLKYCKLMYTYDQAELNELIQKVQDRIEVKSQKRSQNKYSVAALK